MPVRHRGRLIVLGVIAALVIMVAGVIIVVNSSLFAATDIQVRSSEHVSQREAEQLTRVPKGSTLLNVDVDDVGAGIMKNPWVERVDIDRRFPHTLIVTPHERTVAAIAYINADDIAWAIGSDETWIAPVSLAVTVDADGEIVSPAADGVDDGTDRDAAGAPGAPSAGETALTGFDAACAIARKSGAVVLTQVPSTVSPASGRKVDTDVVLAGLKYATGFSRDFIAEIKDIDVAKVEGIEANLTSGVQVMLGEPDDIETKEQVIRRFLAQEKGVSVINVRTPGSYTFRSVPNT